MKELSIVFWNVENLFDDIDDPHWFDDNISTYQSTELYELKIKRLSEILKPWAKKKSVICLAEIENRAVLEKLLYNLPFPNEYQIVYHHNDFARIKQAILSPLQIKNSKALDYARGLRPILQADLIWAGYDLTLFVNHWKSRRGGNKATQKRRMLAAKFLTGEIQQIRSQNKAAEILVIGDFNDEPWDDSIKKGLQTSSNKKNISLDKQLLYNFMGANKLYEGTQYHEGEWQTFDQAIVSPGLLDDHQMYVKKCEILSDKKLIYKEHRPNRFGGPDLKPHQRGYSDHLPIVITLGLH